MFHRHTHVRVSELSLSLSFSLFLSLSLSLTLSPRLQKGWIYFHREKRGKTEGSCAWNVKHDSREQSRRRLVCGNGRGRNDTVALLGAGDIFWFKVTSRKPYQSIEFPWRSVRVAASLGIIPRRREAWKDADEDADNENLFGRFFLFRVTQRVNIASTMACVHVPSRCSASIHREHSSRLFIPLPRDETVRRNSR